ncbi:hypothetical protein PQX77_014492 [Marasmius sp. AFHP31]|nr:hypothetical protein PQX77_014492 [Marasmius sp. AFHP31]
MFIDVFAPFLQFLVFALLACLSNAQVTSQGNFSPASFPLAVRSPHLNAWIAPGNGSRGLAGTWMRHWDDQSVMAWEGLVRVDGTTYRWLGDSGHGNGTSLLSSEVTPTRSKFTILAGTVRLQITFLSPIEPDDWVLQSLPFVYLAVNVISTDGQPHNVQLYSDVTGEWISGDSNSLMAWDTTPSDSTIYHHASRTLPTPMTEIKNIAEDATVYFGTASGSSLTWQTGGDKDTRGGFQSSGVLNNTRDTNANPRPIKNNWPVMAFAFDLGNITSTTSPTVLSLGLVRDPVVSYSTSLNKNDRSPYFRTRFDDVGEAVNFFIKDYENAAKRADELDQRIMKDASAISNNYRDLVSLGARQAMAGVEITVARGTDKAWNMSDVKAFMKDMGVSQRISPVDGIFSAFPIFLYLNASLGGLLLDPLLETQALSGGSDSATPDLGVYPKASSSSSSANVGIESTGNMLITALAHAQRSGDGTLIVRYYDLMKRWTEYLISNTLHPKDQASVAYDLSNLAVKGIIGIAAMAKISEALNRNDDSKNYAVRVISSAFWLMPADNALYKAKAADLSSQWVNLATKDGHITSVYGMAGTKPLVYNLYADVLLQTNVIDRSVYTSQTSFYDSLIPFAPRFGLPFDESFSTAEAHAPWTIFTAATVTQNSTRDGLINMVHTKAGFNEIKGNFPVRYRAETGDILPNYGQASPAQGAMFALLAQSVPIQHVASSPSGSSTATSKAGSVAGAVIGSLAGIGLVVVGVLYWRKKREAEIADTLKPVPFDPNLLYRRRPTDEMAMRNGTPTRMTQFHGQDSPLLEGQQPMHSPYSPDYSMTSPSTYRSHQPSQSVSASSYSNGGSTMYTTDTHQLRNEIANLRAQMQDLQEMSVGSTTPPPPRYS